MKMKIEFTLGLIGSILGILAGTFGIIMLSIVNGDISSNIIGLILSTVSLVFTCKLNNKPRVYGIALILFGFIVFQSNMFAIPPGILLIITGILSLRRVNKIEGKCKFKDYSKSDKKSLIIILVSAILSLILCFSAGTSSDDTSYSANENSGISINEGSSSQQSKLPAVTVDKLSITLTLEPSGDYTYIKATYTNNSDKIITSFTNEILFKNLNEKSYLNSYDTILQGETSPVFESIVEGTITLEDIEILRSDINYKAEDGTSKYVYYDVKLQEYTW